MKGFFAPIALTLFHSDCLSRRLDFDAVKVELKTAYLFQPFASSYEHRLALQLRVAGDLLNKLHRKNRLDWRK